MTDIFENQTAFEGTTSPVGDSKPNGKTPRRKARGSRKTARGKAEAIPASTPIPTPKKRGRPAGAKAKAVRHGRPAGPKILSPATHAQPNGTGKLLLSVVGLDEAETSFVASMLAALENHPKKSRAKIVASLGRIFA